MKEEIIHLGYYDSIVTNRKKDLTRKELDSIEETKIRNQSMIIVGVFFAVIIIFAALAKHGDVFI